jgi:DNA-binding LacI/PurR family transcriptional regulator
VGRRVTDPRYATHVKTISESVPFVTTGKVDGVNCYKILIDNAGAMRQIFDHLTALGHAEIALIGGMNSVQSTYDKWRQYIYQLGRFGLSFREDFVMEGNYTAQGGFLCACRLLRNEKKPTAIIAVNDYTAAGALRAISEQNLRVPGDISLVSFDNTFLSEILSPQLTSIDYDYPLLGRMLIETAINALSGPGTPYERSIPATLVIRDSTADKNPGVSRCRE